MAITVMYTLCTQQVVSYCYMAWPALLELLWKRWALEQSLELSLKAAPELPRVIGRGSLRGSPHCLSERLRRALAFPRKPHGITTLSSVKKQTDNSVVSLRFEKADQTNRQIIAFLVRRRYEGMPTSELCTRASFRLR